MANDYLPNSLLFSLNTLVMMQLSMSRNPILHALMVAPCPLLLDCERFNKIIQS